MIGDGYGCPTCGPDVYCRDDAGEDYGPEPDDVDPQPVDPWAYATRGPADWPDEKPF